MKIQIAKLPIRHWAVQNNIFSKENLTWAFPISIS